jgi:hypothetical protein
LVEHWLFGLGACLGQLVHPLAGGTLVWGVRGPGTLLGPEGTAAWWRFFPCLRAGGRVW